MKKHPKRKHPSVYIRESMGQAILLKPPQVLRQDLIDSGFMKLGKQFAHGFLEGQDDDPTKIIVAMKEQGIEMVLFHMDKDDPLGVEYSVWIPKCAEFDVNKFEATDTKQDLPLYNVVAYAIS